MPTDPVVNGAGSAEPVQEDSVGDELSDMELSLLRAALVQHGLRLGALESKLDQQMEDLHSIIGIVRQAHARMRHIADALGIDAENPESGDE